MKILRSPGSAFAILPMVLFVLGSASQTVAQTAAGMEGGSLERAARADGPAGPRGSRDAERSGTLTVTVNGASAQMTVADLMSMPQTTIKVHNAHSDRDESYTGVRVADLLARGGLAFSKDTQTRLLHSYLRAQGTDFYFVLYSATEVIPALRDGEVIVATQMDGHEIGDDGRFKLVSSGDTRPARWVRNLASLTLATVN